MNSIVNYHLDNQIATITMDDGKANALSPILIEQLNNAFDQAKKDQAIVILTGREGKFSAGFDLKIMNEAGPAREQLVQSGAKLAQRLMLFPKPIIMACSGHCLAMGALLLLVADHRIGYKGPFKIGLNEVAIGLTMPRFGVELAFSRLNKSHLFRSVVNAEIFSSEEAVSAGFLDSTIEPEALLEHAKQVALGLSKLDMTAYYETKIRLREKTSKKLEQAIMDDFADSVFKV